MPRQPPKPSELRLTRTGASTSIRRRYRCSPPPLLSGLPQRWHSEDRSRPAGLLSTLAEPGCSGTNPPPTRRDGRCSISMSWCGPGEPDTVLEWRSDWAPARTRSAERSRSLCPASTTPTTPSSGGAADCWQPTSLPRISSSSCWWTIAGPEPTACASFNHHLDHFTATFDITMVDGGPAHTACLGFGHERIVLALLARHGFDTESWPREVQDRLALAD